MFLKLSSFGFIELFAIGTIRVGTQSHFYLRVVSIVGFVSASCEAFMILAIRGELTNKPIIGRPSSGGVGGRGKVSKNAIKSCDKKYKCQLCWSRMIIHSWSFVQEGFRSEVGDLNGVYAMNIPETLHCIDIGCLKNMLSALNLWASYVAFCT